MRIQVACKQLLWQVYAYDKRKWQVSSHPVHIIHTCSSYSMRKKFGNMAMKRRDEAGKLFFSGCNRKQELS